MLKKISNLQLFIFACVVALFLVLLGLRGYFSQSRLNTQLSKVVDGASFVVLNGSVKRDKQFSSLQVYGDSSSASSIIVKSLDIETAWFERVEVKFANKPSLQVLTLSVGSRNSPKNNIHWVEQPILYTDHSISRLPVQSFTDRQSRIVSLKLSTPRLIAPYVLKSIDFVPKTFDNTSFLSLLWTDLFCRQTATLISPKLFLVIYFSVVSLLFGGLLLWLKRPIAKVWWWVLVAAWLLLDIRYLYQQSQDVRADQLVPTNDQIASLVIQRWSV